MEKTIPAERKGKQTDLSFYIEAKSNEEAHHVFECASRRLLHPQSWAQIAGEAGAVFQLFNQHGEELNTPAKQDEFIRINIPGPGSLKGDGFDWVKITKLDTYTNTPNEEESIAITVHPSSDPQKLHEPTAHFFTKEASSTFLINREGRFVYSSYFGRNEQLNNETGDRGENIRNTLIGIGALAGFSEIQWTALMKGLITK